MVLFKKILLSKLFFISLFVLSVFLFSQHPVLATSCNSNGFIVNDDGTVTTERCIQVNTSPTAGGGTGIQIPTLSIILTFAIRMFFIIGGLAALLFLLLGALAWITSGGDKENVSKAQAKITNAIIGVILIAVVLAVIVTLEQVVFGGKICLGLSCPLTIPSLVK